jgi:3D (Asp-Asp-Asp) domain-containing protein
MKSLFRRSAVIAATILSSSLLLSARSSPAETLLSSFQKPTQELSQGSKQDPKGLEVPSIGTATIDNASKVVIAEDAGKDEKALLNSTAAAKTATTIIVAPVAPNPSGALTMGSDPNAMLTGPVVTYTATAYSLGGRTASGVRVSKGLIAADPRVLPLGTRVRLEAGAYSGDYLVADTGGAVHGKRIDIWTPNSREANRFGRRLVKLTVLSYPVKRAKALRKLKD